MRELRLSKQTQNGPAKHCSVRTSNCKKSANLFVARTIASRVPVSSSQRSQQLAEQCSAPRLRPSLPNCRQNVRHRFALRLCALRVAAVEADAHRADFPASTCCWLPAGSSNSKNEVWISLQGSGTAFTPFTLGRYVYLRFRVSEVRVTE